MIGAETPSAVAHARAPISDAQAIELLRRAIEIASISGHEAPVARFLVDQARRFGLRAEIDAAGNFAAATAGDPLRSGGDRRDVVLLGHMDTVPGHVPVRIEGDRLYGRGAVDAKGPLAAFLCAAAAVELPAGVRVVVIGAVEEETPTSRGARAVIDRYRPAACIIGEPSGWDGVTLGYKGRLVVNFTLQRGCGHSAGPHGSVADSAADWWRQAQARAIALAPTEGGPFGQVQATLRSFQTFSDGLNDRVEVTAGFRLPPGVPPEAVRAACAAALPAGAALTVEGAEHAVTADRTSGLVRTLTGQIRAAGARPRLVYKTGTSDMNVVSPAWGCPVAAYGPGDSALDHTPDEHIDLREYLAAIGVLRRALAALPQTWPGPSADAPARGAKPDHSG